MRKLVSIGLSALLLYHTLAYGFLVMASWWQAEHDLSKRLLVYSSVDSMVEFEIPVSERADAVALSRTTNEGFVYKGHYYDVVSLDVRGKNLFITAMETENQSFWRSDLLSFLNEHLADAPNAAGKKAHDLLKFLLKEYSPLPHSVYHFFSFSWREAVQIPDLSSLLLHRSLPVFSPPPEA